MHLLLENRSLKPAWQMRKMLGSFQTRGSLRPCGRFNMLGLAGLMLVGFAMPVVGQEGRSPSPREFIQSSSPTGDGGMIVSRSSPGSQIQTFTARGDLQSRAQSPTVGFEPRRASADNRWANVSPGPQYVYPAGAQFSPPTNTLGFQPIGNRQTQATSFYQQNGPPINPPNCANCVTNPSVPSLQYPTQVAPQPNFAPFDTTSQPWLNTNQIGVGGVGQTGRVNYSPLINLRNLPPGTYLGQGVIGQPKAYVDGEPVRNLFRYILP